MIKFIIINLAWIHVNVFIWSVIESKRELRKDELDLLIEVNDD